MQKQRDEGFHVLNKTISMLKHKQFVNNFTVIIKNIQLNQVFTILSVICTMYIYFMYIIYIYKFVYTDLQINGHIFLIYALTYSSLI